MAEIKIIPRKLGDWTTRRPPSSLFAKILRMMPRADLQSLAADCAVLDTSEAYYRSYVELKIIEAAFEKDLIAKWLLAYIVEELKREHKLDSVMQRAFED